MGEICLKHPEKWRETCDPFSLNYHAFRPVEILGYPHAGNDVFHVRGLYEGKEITAYVKAARQKGADIGREAEILRKLSFPCIPRVIDCDLSGIPFSVTEEMPGQRLSVIVGDNRDLESLSYMEEYGETLAKLHGLPSDAAPVADRKFFHAPSQALLDKLELTALGTYFAETPADPVMVFCHGDFHYANILWEDHHISSILDFELSGCGSRDFDIAWALIRRPGQKFLKTEEERRRFLAGYSRYGRYDDAAVRYHMAQIYVYFLEFSGNDKEYCQYVRKWLGENCL